MLYRSEEEIEKIKKSSLLVGKTLGEIARILKTGITTASIDRIAEEFIRDHGGVPAFKGYNGFPATLCISINDQIVHGIPGNNEIQDGDLVSIDCGAVLDGFYGDYAYTFAVGNVDPETLKLAHVTKEALELAVLQAVAGQRVGDIGYVVQQHVEKHGYSVVRDLVGHGIGKHLHEKPNVPNFGKRGNGAQLPENMVICIEPMVNMGSRDVVQEKDGWTMRTRDRKPSAHFEHMVVVRKEHAEVISTYEYIENNWKQ